MRGGRLVTPAEAEDLPSLSLVDASLVCPSSTLQDVSTTQELYVLDHPNRDVDHGINLVGAFDA